MIVDCVLEDERWAEAGSRRWPNGRQRRRCGRLGLTARGFEIAVLGCDDARIAELNTDFRGKPAPTNVLSWPATELGAATEGAWPAPPVPGSQGDTASLGDIALAFETCRREAAEAGRPFADHVLHLVVHGVLHLCGFDHRA